MNSNLIKSFSLTLLSSTLFGFSLLGIIRRFFYPNFLLEEILIVSLVSFLLPIFFKRLKFQPFNFIYKSLAMESRVFVILLMSFVMSLTNLTLLVHSIANIDRSRSISIFEKIGCSPTSNISTIESQIQLKFGNEEVKSFELRLHEMQSRRLVTLNENEVHLNALSFYILKISFIASDVFHLENFKHSRLWPSNKCFI